MTNVMPFDDYWSFLGYNKPKQRKFSALPIDLLDLPSPKQQEPTQYEASAESAGSTYAPASFAAETGDEAQANKKKYDWFREPFAKASARANHVVSHLPEIGLGVVAGIGIRSAFKAAAIPVVAAFTPSAIPSALALATVTVAAGAFSGGVVGGLREVYKTHKATPQNDRKKNWVLSSFKKGAAKGLKYGALGSLFGGVIGGMLIGEAAAATPFDGLSIAETLHLSPDHIASASPVNVSNATLNMTELDVNATHTIEITPANVSAPLEVPDANVPAADVPVETAAATPELVPLDEAAHGHALRTFHFTHGADNVIPDEYASPALPATTEAKVVQLWDESVCSPNGSQDIFAPSTPGDAGVPEAPTAKVEVSTGCDGDTCPVTPTVSTGCDGDTCSVTPTVSTGCDGDTCSVTPTVSTDCDGDSCTETPTVSTDCDGDACTGTPTVSTDCGGGCPETPTATGTSVESTTVSETFNVGEGACPEQPTATETVISSEKTCFESTTVSETVISDEGTYSESSSTETSSCEGACSRPTSVESACPQRACTLG